MKIEYKEYTITDDETKMKLDSIKALIKSSYWAENRTEDTIIKSIEHSICFGIFKNEEQVGFARVVSDFSTMYWLCDVLVFSEYQGQGLGKKLVESIVTDKRFEDLLGILATRDAHGLYQKYGFEKDNGRFMRKPRS